MQIRSGLGFESWRLGVYLPQVTHAPPEGIIPAPHQRIKCPNPRACLAWVQFFSFTQQGFVEFLLSARSHRRCCGYSREQRERKIPILMAFAFQLGKIVNKHVINKQQTGRQTCPSGCSAVQTLACLHFESVWTKSQCRNLTEMDQSDFSLLGLCSGDLETESFHTVLEARNPRWRCWQDGHPLAASSGHLSMHLHLWSPFLSLEGHQAYWRKVLPSQLCCNSVISLKILFPHAMTFRGTGGWDFGGTQVSPSYPPRFSILLLCENPQLLPPALLTFSWAFLVGICPSPLQNPCLF